MKAWEWQLARKQVIQVSETQQANDSALAQVSGDRQPVVADGHQASEHAAGHSIGKGIPAILGLTPVVPSTVLPTMRNVIGEVS